MSISVGDFNGDGNLDLAVANSGGNTVTVLLGKGDGTFAAKSETPATGTNPSSVAVADFNGDGKPDIAVANLGSNNVTILLGNGDETFTASSARPATGTGPLAIAVADFNGDGKLDLATANCDSGTVTIMLVKGNGTFTATSISLPAGNTPASIAVDDFNGVGEPDFVTADYTSGFITLLTGKGNGTFTTADYGPGGKGDYPFRVAVADFNGDGPSAATIENDANINVSVLLSEELWESVSFSEGLTALGTGVHEAEAIYLGDALNSDSSSALFPLNAEQVTPTVVLVSSSESSTIGTAITFTATVGGDPGIPPSGKVEFYAGTIPLGAVLLGANAVAALTTTALPEGSDELTAVYRGNRDYGANVSNTVKVQMNPLMAPSIKIAATPVTATLGASVTINVRVSGSSSIPTGTITFCDGDKRLGSETLKGGVASYSTKVLASGLHSIKSTYLGDEHYKGASSVSVTVTVK